MTIIKTKGVCGDEHQKHLRDYINDDRKVLLRDSQNMEECADIKRWASFMSKTRRAFGHDRPSRAGRNGNPAKNIVLIHTVFAFLPEECSVNGGKMTPDMCMAYAKEYAARYWPNQQVVFALHDEYCKTDKTHRLAVHAVVNRTDIIKGTRLNEGRGDHAKAMRAKRIREMDEEWGLKQVEKGKANSAIHKRQPSKTEREIEGRSGDSYKCNLRELCRIAAEEAETVYQFREMLEGWGVQTEFRNGRMYAMDTDNDRYSFSVSKLDSELDAKGLEARFRQNVAADIRAKGEAAMAARQAERLERERIDALKHEYLENIRKAFVTYRSSAKGIAGTPYDRFPRLKLKRPPVEVAKDSEVQRTILAYWRGADELRHRLASDVPRARSATPQGGQQPAPQRRVPEPGRGTPSPYRGGDR